MAQTIRVSLPGYNALTDTNPDHFSLYADQDWVLIKEKTRGNGTIGGNSTLSINHNLGYPPMAAGFYRIPAYSDYLTWCCGIRDWVEMTITSSQLKFKNYTSQTAYVYYYIFFDQQV
jgi:hypothetical protein